MDSVNVDQNITFNSIGKSLLNGLRFFRLLWGTEKGYLIIIILIELFQGLTPIANIFALQNLVNSVYKGWDSGFTVIGVAISIFMLVMIFQETLGLLYSYYNGLLQTLVTNRINILVMDKATSLGLADYENSKVQDQLKRAQQEASYRPYQMFMQILSIVKGVVTLISAAAVLVYWKWWLVLILILMSLSSFYSLYRLNKEQFSVNWNRAPLYRESWYLSYILTNDQAFKEVKLYNLGNYLLRRYKDIYQNFYLTDKRLLKRRILISSFFESINLLGIGTVIFLVVKATLLKEILFGSLIGYIQAVSLTHLASQSLIQGILQISQHNLYIEQLFIFLNLPTSDPVKLQIKEKNEHHTYLKNIETIEFHNVSFKYPGSNVYVLQNVNFVLKRGEVTAIVGHNGSGKTTIIKLLTQLYNEYRGEILVNNVDIKNIDIGAYQKLIGVVFQDFMRYEMSVRHNIGFGNMNYYDNDTKLLDACQYVGIRNMIQEFPQQLNTHLGKWLSNGIQLSGGQWQKIAIARAFLRDADVYVFDEPSSFLDSKAEAEIFDQFYNLIKNKIGVFISHRYSSVRYADRILVMDDGKIIEQGDHDTLIKLDGKYAELYRLQMHSYLNS